MPTFFIFSLCQKQITIDSLSQTSCSDSGDSDVFGEYANSGQYGDYGELGEFDGSGKYSDSGETGDSVETRDSSETGIFCGFDFGELLLSSF